MTPLTKEEKAWLKKATAIMNRVPNDHKELIDRINKHVSDQVHYYKEHGEYKQGLIFVLQSIERQTKSAHEKS